MELPLSLILPCDPVFMNSIHLLVTCVQNLYYFIQQMYESLKIRYLLDPEDTIEHYEALGRKNSEDAKLSAEETITNQVNSLGRVGQIELLHGELSTSYNNAWTLVGALAIS